MSYASLLLVARPDRAQATILAADMADWLTARGVTARVFAHSAGQRPDAAAREALRAAASEAQAVVVLGGDGTFIGVARQLIGARLPFLGINCGRLGFLTEISASAWREALHDMLAGLLRIAPRTVLAWSLERDGVQRASGYAINDVFIGRGPLARVVNVHVSVRQQEASTFLLQPQPAAPSAAQAALQPDAPFAFPSAASSVLQPAPWTDLGWVRADGIIVASPLGSSAYSLSARGPLVHPDMSNLLVTAVAPFMGGLPPLVLPGESCVRISPETSIDAGDMCLTVDGQEGIALHSGDSVHVGGVADGVRMLVRQADSYFQTLRCRGVIRVAESSDALLAPIYGAGDQA